MQTDTFWFVFNAAYGREEGPFNNEEMEEQLETANFNDSLEVKVVDARNRALIADDNDSQAQVMESKSLKRKLGKQGG